MVFPAAHCGAGTPSRLGATAGKLLCLPTCCFSEGAWKAQRGAMLLLFLVPKLCPTVCDPKTEVALGLALQDRWVCVTRQVGWAPQVDVLNLSRYREMEKFWYDLEVNNI